MITMPYRLATNRRGMGDVVTLAISYVTSDSGNWHIWGSGFQAGAVVKINGMVAPIYQAGSQRLDVHDPTGGAGGSFQVINPDGGTSNSVTAGPLNTTPASLANAPQGSLQAALLTTGGTIGQTLGFLGGLPTWALVGGGIAAVFLLSKIFGGHR